jgi:hypothetical protein
MTDPTKAITALAARQLSKPKATPTPVVVTPAPPLPTTLPHWPDHRRAAPSAALRSALFPALGRVKRRRLWDEPIFAVGDVVVTFRGEQLDQSDLDIYLEILHLLRGRGEVSFTAHAMLKALGKSTGRSDHEWLRDVILRLAGGLVRIKLPDHPEYFGSLVDGGFRDDATGQYVLSVNSKLARLVGAAWSSLDIGQRRALRTPTAKALHAYLSSHRNPGPHRLDTLVGIAGLTGAKAKATIQKALEALQGAGFLSGYVVDGDLVTPRLAPKLSTDGQPHKAPGDGIANPRVTG